VNYVKLRSHNAPLQQYSIYLHSITEPINYRHNTYRSIQFVLLQISMRAIKLSLTHTHTHTYYLFAPFSTSLRAAFKQQQKCEHVHKEKEREEEEFRLSNC
jgi:hypothetical protein